MGLLSSLLFKFISGEGVSVVSDFELSRVHVEDGPDEDILELDAGVLAPFEEDSLVFYIVLDNPKKYHFDGVVLGVVGEVVGPDEGGVGVEPFHHEDVILIGHLILLLSLNFMKLNFMLVNL